MILRFTDSEGRHLVATLGSEPIVIGRSVDADLAVAETKISRHHAEIRLWDGDYVIRDLKSRNGVFLNDQRIQIAVLKLGDQIRIGNIVFHVEDRIEKGTGTILKEVSSELESGKGYTTMLREIVQSSEPRGKHDKPIAANGKTAKP
ncbi:MAG: FHA domain-containing protein [bacterium]